MALNSIVYACVAALITAIAIQIEAKLFDRDYDNASRLKIMALVGVMVYGTLEWLPSDLVFRGATSSILGEPIRTGPAPF